MLEETSKLDNTDIGLVGKTKRSYYLSEKELEAAAIKIKKSWDFCVNPSMKKIELGYLGF